MADCIMCKCEDIKPTGHECEQLQRENNAKLREFAIMYRDLQTCDLAEYGAKGFYNVWCMVRNLTAQVCALWERVNKLQAPQNLSAGNNITIENGRINAIIPPPKNVDLSGYVTKAEYNQLKNAFDKVIENLRNSGAWQGDSINGNFVQGRNIATGNINLFGGTQDGNAFIRTNNGRTENDLTGGI